MQDEEYRPVDTNQSSTMEKNDADASASSGPSRHEIDANQLLFQKAVELVLLHDNASVSFLQRNLRLGYSNAQEALAAMEGKWVTPVQPDGFRRVIRAPSARRLVCPEKEVLMGLKTTDFLLTSAEIEEINRYVRYKTAAHATAGEDPPDGIRVVFEFDPAFGLDVTVYFNGAVNGYSITDSLAKNND